MNYPGFLMEIRPAVFRISLIFELIRFIRPKPLLENKSTFFYCHYQLDMLLRGQSFGCAERGRFEDWHQRHPN